MTDGPRLDNLSPESSAACSRPDREKTYLRLGIVPTPIYPGISPELDCIKLLPIFLGFWSLGHDESFPSCTEPLILSPSFLPSTLPW